MRGFILLNKLLGVMYNEKGCSYNETVLKFYTIPSSSIENNEANRKRFLVFDMIMEAFRPPFAKSRINEEVEIL